MSFNYYHTNYIMPTLMIANKEFFLKTILPVPNNMQVFVEKESYKIAVKNYQGQANKPVIKNITANTINEYFIVFVEFDDNYVVDDSDNFAVAIAITKNNDIRYFTYEKGTDVQNGDDLYFVGEFKLNGKDIGEHINYGRTSEYKISYFAGKIEEIIKGE